MRNWLLVWCVLLPAMAQAMPDKDDYVVTLVRHGDRSPRYPMETKLWPMGAGELTGQGFQQCFEAGKKFRAAQLPAGFPELWTPELSVHRSRGLDRTIQCANTMLQAIYPGNRANGSAFAAVPPVYAVPMNEDFVLGSPNACPGYHYRIKQLEKTSSWQKQKEALGAEKMALWSRYSGQPATLHGMVRFADTLNARKIHGVPRPEFLSAQDENKLLEVMDWYFEQVSHDKTVIELASYHLLETIQNHYKQHRECLREGRSQCQYFYLMSVSDINVLAMFSVLGLPQNKNVPYAGMLTLRFNQKSGLSVTFNDQLQKLPCGESCNLEQWNQLVAASQVDNWPDLCWPQELEASIKTPDMPSGSKKEK
ncbi:histidine-type phosphatase [Endozoicomonas arenosclerae]|uniref:histidine-type phosphatase n=1 Tax=Endozoicomonas arenosclerae TaxID=1633495 RepID=UPI000783F444|nr:histidine-type phosphatase [Endozoicomonas arenosclerae]